MNFWVHNGTSDDSTIHLSKCPLPQTILNYYMAGGNFPLVSGDCNIVDSYRLLWSNVKHGVVAGFLSVIYVCDVCVCVFRLGGLNDKYICNDLGKSEGMPPTPKKIFLYTWTLCSLRNFSVQLEATVLAHISRICSNCCTVFCNQSSYQRTPHSATNRATRGRHILQPIELPEDATFCNQSSYQRMPHSATNQATRGHHILQPIKLPEGTYHVPEDTTFMLWLHVRTG